MNLFKTYTYTWWQIGIFKLCLLVIGIVIGAYWHELVMPHLVPLLAIGAVLAVYLISISLSQARK